MALIICSECKKRISDTALSCPSCGYLLSPERVSGIKEESAEAQEKLKNHARLLFKTGVVILVIFSFLIYLSNRGESSKITTGGASKAKENLSYRKHLVWTLTQDIIKKYLKSPSTASFGRKGLYPEQDTETCVTNLDNDIFSVKGWVDSQNSFGAITRTKFLLKMKCDGKNWELLEIPIMGEY